MNTTMTLEHPHRHRGGYPGTGLVSPMTEKELAVCDECGSLFFKGSSQMMGLCPECAQDRKSVV